MRRAAASLLVTLSDGRGRPVRAGGLGRWLAAVAPRRARGDVAIALVSDAAVRRLNRQYRRQDRPTDVLAFPASAARVPGSGSRVPGRGFRVAGSGSRVAGSGSRVAGSGSRVPDPGSRVSEPGTRIPHPGLGDILIATGVARRQAREAGHPYGTELRVLALHGLLHLLGYDHHSPDDRGRMARLEARLRRKGGLASGLIERSTRRLRPARGAGGKRRSAAPPSARERGWGPASSKK